MANAALICGVFAVLALTPLAVKSPLEPSHGGALSLASLAAILALNLVIARRSLAPLARLTDTMRSVDLYDADAKRVPAYGRSAEVLALTDAFNEMIDRLQSERRESATRILAAQEAERRHVALELHDEVGQRLTALMLELDLAARTTDGPASARFASAREDARAALEEIRAIAARLRPEILDDVGLAEALRSMAARFAQRSGVAVEQDIDGDLPQLGPSREAAVYRIAQESLTNVARHAGATHVELELRCTDRALRLRVADDGRGFADLNGGTGVSGMRERAMLIGGVLEVGPAVLGGAEVTLAVPLETS